MCQPGYRLSRDYGGAVIECQACETGQVCLIHGNFLILFVSRVNVYFAKLNFIII